MGTSPCRNSLEISSRFFFGATIQGNGLGIYPPTDIEPAQTSREITVLHVAVGYLPGLRSLFTFLGPFLVFNKNIAM
jgi:hypothetical protein